MDPFLAPLGALDEDLALNNNHGWQLGASFAGSNHLPMPQLDFDDDLGGLQGPGAMAHQHSGFDSAYAKLMPEPLASHQSNSDADWFSLAGEKRKGPVDLSTVLGTGSSSSGMGQKHPRYDSHDDDDIVVTNGVNAGMNAFAFGSSSNAMHSTGPILMPPTLPSSWPVHGSNPVAIAPAVLASSRVTRSVTANAQQPSSSRALSTISEESERTATTDNRTSPGAVAAMEPADGSDLDEDDDEQDDDEFAGSTHPRTGSSPGHPGSDDNPDDDEFLVVLPRSLAAALGRKGRLPFHVAYPRGHIVNGADYSVGVYGVTNGQRAARLGAFQALRARRIFYKKVKYGQRHILANGRQRIKGRFVKDDTPGAAPPKAPAKGALAK